MMAPPSSTEMPEQVKALFTVMVGLLMAVLPAANATELPLVKGTFEAVNVELGAQLAVVVSHVPLLAAEAPLLSHHC
jgi:hypothetical protein